MIILTRRVGEQILINKGQIKIKILFEHDGNVVVGIQAPPHVDVDGKQIFMRKLASARLANLKLANDKNFNCSAAQD
ncbi:carbon storage regulator [Legionella sp. D16C41]|uniref:carbon storage regulator n=1 Tax=Legionella sp. D16C41 TaxID=3402688 RepID=UPI003AF78A3B